MIHKELNTFENLKMVHTVLYVRNYFAFIKLTWCLKDMH